MKRSEVVWVMFGPGHILREARSAGVAKENGVILGSVWRTRDAVFMQVGKNPAWKVPNVEAGKAAVEAVVLG